MIEIFGGRDLDVGGVELDEEIVKIVLGTDHEFGFCVNKIALIFVNLRKVSFWEIIRNTCFIKCSNSANFILPDSVFE